MRSRDVVDRRPTAVVLKSILGFSSTFTAWGLVPLPGSLRNGPDVFGQGAALILWAGCIISLVGLLWRRPRRGPRTWDEIDRDRLDGLVIEQVGLTGVGVGSLMYAVALFTVPRFSDAAIAFGMSLGIAVAAAVQHWIIHRYRKGRLIPHGGGDAG